MSKEYKMNKSKRVNKNFDDLKCSPKITGWLTRSAKIIVSENNANRIIENTKDSAEQYNINSKTLSEQDNLENNEVTKKPNNEEEVFISRPRTYSRKRNSHQNNHKITSWVFCSPKTVFANNTENDVNKLSEIFNIQESKEMVKCNDSDLKPVVKQGATQKSPKKGVKCYNVESSKVDTATKILSGEISMKDNTIKCDENTVENYTQKRIRHPKILDDYVYNKKITSWLIVSPKNKVKRNSLTKAVSDCIGNRLENVSKIDKKVNNSENKLPINSIKNIKSLPNRLKKRFAEIEETNSKPHVKKCKEYLIQPSHAQSPKKNQRALKINKTPIMKKTSRSFRKQVSRIKNNSTDENLDATIDNPTSKKSYKISTKTSKAKRENTVKQSLKAKRKQTGAQNSSSGNMDNTSTPIKKSINNMSIIKSEVQNYVGKRIPKKKVGHITKSQNKRRAVRKKPKGENTKGTLECFLNKNKQPKETGVENNNHDRGERSGYDKYGIKLNSFSEIVKDRENLESYNDKVNKAMDFIQQVKISKGIDKLNSTNESRVILGCDLLTPLEIEEYFRKFLPFMKGIIEGSEYNWRHEHFINNLNYNIDKLNYNLSMVTFTRQQKDQLADLCTEQFDKYPILDHHKYYFNVLLPELCLRIFMDVHQMEHDDAVDYLERRPVDDV